MTEDKISKYSKLFEESYGAWIAFGLLIIFFSLGSVTIKFGTAVLTVGEKVSLTFQAIIILTGLLLFLIGIYAIAHRKFRVKSFLPITLSVIYLAAVLLFFTFDVLQKDKLSAFKEWNYVPRENKLITEIRSSVLKDIHDSDLVIVAWKIDAQNDYLNDENIEVGQPFKATEAKRGDISKELICDNLKDDLMPYDRLKLFLFSIPTDTNLNNIISIGQLIELGAKEIGNSGTSTGTNYSRKDHVEYFYNKELIEDERELLLEIACQIDKCPPNS